jgi:N-acetylneuraminic acid mutarotase
MRKILLAIPLLWLAQILQAAQPTLPALSVPVTDNAVAAMKNHGHWTLYSFMGIGAKKTWDDITPASYALEPGAKKWELTRPVPGPVGRIGVAAVAARDHIFLFGGFVADRGGRGTAVPDVNVYEPSADRWWRGADMPVPVGDAVAGVFMNRFIYILGGRANNGAAVNVQIYDAEKNKWRQGAPLPSYGVFGHAGAIVDDTILYVDGVFTEASPNGPRFVSTDECWYGKINHGNPTKIRWERLPNHPGDARFNIAAGGSQKDEKIYFSGGSAEGYDYTGRTNDGKTAVPSPMTFDFDLRRKEWEVIDDSTPHPIMNQHGLLVTDDGVVLIGGMEQGSTVSSQVTLIPTGKKKN